MANAAMPLAELQRQLAAVIMTPLTADDGMRESTPEGRSTRAISERVIAPNSRLDAFERLELYNQQYWYRVLDSLAEDFSSLRTLLGSRSYHQLAVAYLSAHPSRSFTLRNLGSKLPQWLASHAEFTGRRHKLAVDVANIEWAFIEAFDNAELKPLAVAEALHLTAESRVRLQPHLRLVALKYPADELVLDAQHRERAQPTEAGRNDAREELKPLKLAAMRSKSTWLAVHRVDFSVYFKRIEKEEHAILSAIESGATLGAAISQGFKGTRIPASNRAAKLRAWFENWAELGWLCAPEI